MLPKTRASVGMALDCEKASGHYESIISPFKLYEVALALFCFVD